MLTPERLRQHLNGGEPRGCCPIKEGESTTQSALLDLDSHKGETSWAEMQKAANDVIAHLVSLGMRPIPFRSSGGRGIHLFMLWDAPQPAHAVRAFLHSALSSIGYKDGAGGVKQRQIEVFPKQDRVDVGSYGNMFILPLAGKSEPLEWALGLEPMGRQWAASIEWEMSAPVPEVEGEPPRRATVSPSGMDCDLACKALKAIPNGENLDNRDEWFKLMCAFKEAAGEEGYLTALEWCEQHPSHDEAKFGKAWNSITTGKENGAPADYLFRVAFQHGFTEHIAQEFKESWSDQETIERLSRLSLVEYERCRVEVAARMGMRVSTLDKMVQDAQQEQEPQATNGITFEEVQPWPDQVQGDVLLSDIAETIQRFIICKPETAHAAALWVVMTWVIDVVQVAPLAVITAPEKRCGKSHLLTVLGKLSRRPMVASNISTAALYRVIDAWNPTLIVDEADAFMRDNEEMRGVLNSGHTRGAAYVVRLVGDDHAPTQFSTWGAKAIAGIGKLADTLMDRAITLELRRKLPHEEVERLRHAEPNLFGNLVSRLCRFADDNREAVRLARPPLPQSLNDRAQDNWEPLLAIADVAGGDWPKIAREAALVVSGGTEEATIGCELLADIQEVFDAQRTDKISTQNLIQTLCSDDEKPWATYNRGKSISPRQVSNRLRGYGIVSKDVRVGSDVLKGYERGQFEDVFSRYLPPYTPPFHPLQRYKPITTRVTA